mmetsp:Transcript_787/g.1827  ORF Transcript_787/g.1827 Transcript_787/m.1827 type:complete len:261 (-) Transcript_787:1499-2281(-)
MMRLVVVRLVPKTGLMLGRLTLLGGLPVPVPIPMPMPIRPLPMRPRCTRWLPMAPRRRPSVAATMAVAAGEEQRFAIVRTLLDRWRRVKALLAAAAAMAIARATNSTAGWGPWMPKGVRIGSVWADADGAALPQQQQEQQQRQKKEYSCRSDGEVIPVPCTTFPVVRPGMLASHKGTAQKMMKKKKNNSKNDNKNKNITSYREDSLTPTGQPFPSTRSTYRPKRGRTYRPNFRPPPRQPSRTASRAPSDPIRPIPTRSMP